MYSFDDILTRIRSAYSNRALYFDSGVGITRSGKENDRIEMRQFFATSFFRSASFSMSVHEADIPTKGCHAAWTLAANTSGTMTQLWWYARGVSRPASSFHELLARSTGVCRGLPKWVLPLLLPDAFQFGALALFRAPSIIEDTINGVDCLCLSESSQTEALIESVSLEGEPGTNSMSLWVDRQSCLIKKAVFTTHESDETVDQEAHFECSVTNP